MIKLFRHIRQSLLLKGKTTQYFKYAIGEIALVVIGILIALQINTWNENNKLRKLEIETLSEIKDAMVQDTIVINANLQIISDKIDDSYILIDHIRTMKPYDNKLDTIMMNVYYHKGYNTFNTAAFELLKERGFGIIKNKTLRKQITNHYTSDIADTRSILSRLDNINMIQGERMYENFLVEKGTIKPYNYEQLLEDPKLLGPFVHFQTMNEGYYNRLNEFKEKTTNTLDVLTKELEKRASND